MRNIFLLLVLFLWSLGARSDFTPQDLKALCPFQKGKASSLFSHSLLHEISIAEVEELFAEREKMYGKCKRIEGKKGSFRLVTAEASVPIQIEEKGKKIVQFEFSAPSLTNDTLEKIIKVAASSFERFSIQVSDESKKYFQAEADKALNIGRGAGLFLLAGLNKRVAEGKISLSDVVPLRNSEISFGLLEQWPKGTLLSIDSLKSLIFIESDSAAFDLLLHSIGRQLIQSQGTSLKPFLSMEEYFSFLRFKNMPSDKSKILEQAAQNLKENSAPERLEESSKNVNNLGWFASANELCGLLPWLKDDNVLASTHVTEGTKTTYNDIGFSIVSSYQVRSPGVGFTFIVFKALNNRSPQCLAFLTNDSKGIRESIFADLTFRLVEILKKGNF